MISEVLIPTEIFALLATLAGVAFAATLSALGWLIGRVSKLSTDVAVIRQRLSDLPCDHCPTVTEN